MNIRSYTASFLALAAFFVGVVFSAEGDLLDVRDSKDAPIPIILDTDIGGDIDDAFALALLHRFADQGYCEILGVTLTNANQHAAPYVAAENALYGRPDIPVAIPEKAGRNTDNYPSKTLNMKDSDGNLLYPVPEGFKPEEPVALLRKLLTKAEDGSVVVIQIGFSTNLAALLDTPADEYSPLTGQELVAKKVRFLSVMGGAFAIDPTAEKYRDHKEWNIVNDVPSAQKLAAQWPGPIAFSGYEVGDRARMSTINLKKDYLSKKARFLRDSYENWASKAAPGQGLNHARPTWDLTSVLFVLRPEQGRGYFQLSESGIVKFEDDGKTRFTPDPNGKHYAFLVDANASVRVVEAFANLCSQP